MNGTLAATPGESHNHEMELLKPQYLRVSNCRLRQVLVDSIPNGDQIALCLNSDEKIQFIRQMTEVTNQLQYLDLQRLLWEEYFNIGMKEGQWKAYVSKSYAKHHNVCRSYGYPQHIVEKRQQHIRYQIQTTMKCYDNNSFN